MRGTRTGATYFGGILTGFGIGAYVFGGWAYWMLHHMYVLGVSSWRKLVLLILLPMILILVGAWMAWSGAEEG